MPERHAFTEADDEYLAEFIAKNNPEILGRNGNKLYITLVENPRQWPWSKSHPWQSWRERYKKNTMWFDRKIISYSREQKAASDSKNKVSNEAEATDQAEGRTAKREEPSKATDIAERKRKAPINRQTSTSMVGGDLTGDSVKVSKDISTGSGYSSTTKKISDELDKKPSELDVSGGFAHINETKYHQQSGYDAHILLTSSYQSSAKLPGPLHQEEDDINQTKELAEEEEREIPKKNTGEDDYMHELFGSFIEDGDVTEPENPLAQSDLTSPATERIYPDVRSVPPPDTVEKGPYILGPFDPRPPPVRHPTGPLQGEKRVLKRKVPDDDPFIDNTPPPPSPTPERYLTKRKAPPVLNEGPFRNIFVQTRNPGENNSLVISPPTCKRKENEGSQKITESRAFTTTAVFGRKTQQQVNATASSSKVKLSPSIVLQPDDPFLTGTALQESAQLPVPMRKGAVLSETQADTAAVGKRFKTNKRSWAFVIEQPPTKRQKFGPALARQESSLNTLAHVPTSSPATQNNSRTNNKWPARRHINLHESLRGRHPHSGISSRGSTISNSNSISYHTNRHNSEASFASHNRRQHVSNDVELISLLERDLSELGDLYGFALRIVKQTYLQFGTLEKTVVVLRALNAIMKGAQDKLYEEMQRLGNKQNHDDTDECDLIPQGVVPKIISSGEKEKEIGEQESYCVSSNKRHRQSLNYKPLTTDIEDQSEYSPPSRTRAGRYTKLQKEGREEEALIAASGGTIHLRNWSREGVSDGKESLRRARTIKTGMGPSSPLGLDRERSPTPDEEESVEQRETEGGEEGHYDGGEGDDDIEVVKNDRVDISLDECEVREPTPEVERADDKELGLKAELKKLCSEVTLGNQSILRAFEKRDLSGRDGGDWIVQMFLSLKETQEIRRQGHCQKKFNKTEEVAQEYGPNADEGALS